MRWGVIGSSGLAARTCGPAVEAADGAELVAVLGSSAEGAEAFAQRFAGVTPTSAIDEFLAVDGLEAVWIASPTFLHFEHAVATLEADKHVLLEKPLALSSAQGWKLVELAASRTLLLATGYQARYVPAHHAMARLITEGAIGEVTLARTYYGIHRPGGPPEWRRHRDTAGWGVLADIGTHHVDLLRMLLGEVIAARGLSGHQAGFETEDVASAALSFASGALASLTVTGHASVGGTRVEIHGREGSLLAIDTSPAGQGSVSLHRPGVEPEDVTGERPDAFVAQVEAIERAVEDRAVAYATGEDGARNLEILAEIAAP